jgi:hypothetical protein
MRVWVLASLAVCLSGCAATPARACQTGDCACWEDSDCALSKCGATWEHAREESGDPACPCANGWVMRAETVAEMSEEFGRDCSENDRLRACAFTSCSPWAQLEAQCHLGTCVAVESGEEPTYH